MRRSPAPMSCMRRSTCARPAMHSMEAACCALFAADVTTPQRPSLLGAVVHVRMPWQSSCASSAAGAGNRARAPVSPFALTVALMHKPCRTLGDAVGSSHEAAARRPPQRRPAPPRRAPALP